MAKRKRLNPQALIGEPVPADLETKAQNGWVGIRAPIAEETRDAATRSAFEEVAGELRAARQEGRMVLSLALDAVDETYLVRDRIAVDAEDMASLTDSLRDRGQQTPIEVADLGGGRYGLISGWRRLRALQALAQETGAPGQVLALLRAPAQATDAYRAMIEENEIRADLSFYERARIAVQAVRQGLYSDPKKAVQSLFSAARAPKQSKIVAFTRLVEALDDDLRFPAAIPEKLGLALVQKLQADPGFQRRLQRRLTQAAAPDAAAERLVLDRALKPAPSEKPAPAHQIAPGIRLQSGQGRITLSGAAVDDALAEALAEWVAARGR